MVTENIRWLSNRGRVLKDATGVVIDPSLERGLNGFVLCRYCRKETRNKFTTFCSDFCIHNFKLRSQPHYLRFCTYLRDDGVCQVCKVNCKTLYEDSRALETLEQRVQFFRQLGNDLWKLKAKRCLVSFSNNFTSGMFWETAHILDVQDGGGACGLENIRTLCVPCHHKETQAKAKTKRNLASNVFGIERFITKKIQSRSNLRSNVFGKPLNFAVSTDETNTLSSNPCNSNFIYQKTPYTIENSSQHLLNYRRKKSHAEAPVKRRSFSRLEIDTLIVGIREFGNCWSKIKAAYSSILQLRTPVDLKDKARNLFKKNPNFLDMFD